MTAQEFAVGLAAFAVVNAATLGAIAKWGILRAIDWTHMQRDIKELKEWKVSQEVTNAGVQKDLKGISMKADKKLDRSEAVKL